MIAAFGEVDDVVDVGLLVQSEGIARGIEEQGSGHGQIEPSGVAAAIREQPPDDGHDQDAGGVAEGTLPDPLPAEPRGIRVYQRIDRKADRRSLRDKRQGREDGIEAVMAWFVEMRVPARVVIHEGCVFDLRSRPAIASP